MDCSLQGSSVHGSFQARVLEWVAISYIDRRRTEKTVCSFPLTIWTSTNRVLKITKFSDFIRIKFALAFHLLCVSLLSVPLLISSLPSLHAYHKTIWMGGMRLMAGLTTHLSKEEGWLPWHPKEGHQCSVTVYACLMVVESRSCVWLLQPARLLCPWDSPGQQYWSGLPFPSPVSL